MTDQSNADIDYENLDDLPITEHFEWQYFQAEEVIAKDSIDEPLEWQAA